MVTIQHIKYEWNTTQEGSQSVFCRSGSLIESLLSQHTCGHDLVFCPLLCHLFGEVTALNVHVAPVHVNDSL